MWGRLYLHNFDSTFFKISGEKATKITDYFGDPPGPYTGAATGYELFKNRRTLVSWVRLVNGCLNNNYI